VLARDTLAPWDIMSELSRGHGDFGLTFAGERQKERLERE
jgi:hypothetical protein